MPKVAKETNFQYVVLGMLNHEPHTGYDLKKRIERQISYFWPEVSYSKIYPTLKKLESEKLALMKEERKGNRPTKKVYSITAKGESELKKWLAKPIKIKNITHGFTLFQEFLLKMFFGNNISKEENLHNIHELEKWLENVQKTFNFYENDLRSNLDLHEDHKFFLLTVLFGKGIYEAVSKWTVEAKSILK